MPPHPHTIPSHPHTPTPFPQPTPMLSPPHTHARTQDRNECLRASLGHGNLRATIPVERAVSIFTQFGAPYMTVDLLLDRVRSVHGTVSEGGESRWVSRAEFLEVYGQVQDEERTKMHQQGMLCVCVCVCVCVFCEY